MSENAKEFVVEKVKELMNAASCCADAKAVAQSWLDALLEQRMRQRRLRI